MKKQLCIGLIFCMVLFCLSGCNGKKEEITAEQEEVSAAVEVHPAEKGDIVLSGAFIGTVSPQETVMVFPLVVGEVTKTFFEVGDEVKAGDVLFKIDDANASLQYRQARLSAESARQSADMALGSQQESANLQLENAGSQAQHAYDSAEIAYFNAKDTFDRIDDQVDKQRKYVDELKKAVENYQITVSGNSVAEKMKMETELRTAQATLSSLEANRSQAQTGLYSAENNYKFADESRKTVQANKELAQGATLKDTKEQLQTGIDLADLSVEQAKLALSYYTVKAPVSGVIESKNVEENGPVGTGSPAYTIVDKESMTVTFGVSEAVLNTLSPGQEVRIERGEKQYIGNITEMNHFISQGTGLFLVKAQVRASGDELPNGVSVRVSVDTYHAKQAVLVPYHAVYYENEGAYVYTVKENRAAKTHVETGLFDEENIAILSGLSVGDEVITTWSPKLSDGVLINRME